MFQRKIGLNFRLGRVNESLSRRQFGVLVKGGEDYSFMTYYPALLLCSCKQMKKARTQTLPLGGVASMILQYGPVKCI